MVILYILVCDSFLLVLNDKVSIFYFDELLGVGCFRKDVIVIGGSFL